MYGTIARMHLRPGMEKRLLELTEAEGVLKLPAFVGHYLYRMETSPEEYYLVVLFADRQSYLANADSPEQDARYREIRELLVDDPEWHDGEIILAHSPRPRGSMEG